MSRKLFAIALGCALLVPSAASAHDAMCSPGFWKNHPEVWSTLQVDVETGAPFLALKSLPYCFSATPSYQKPECCVGNENYPYDSFEDLMQALTPPKGEAGCGEDGFSCARHEAAAFLNSCFNRDTYTPCPDGTYPFKD